MTSRKINELFEEMNYYLQTEDNENGAYIILNTIECLSSQFNKDQICEIKNFQYRWEELKAKLKYLALTTDFEKISHSIDQNIEIVLEPEKWQKEVESRVNGAVEKEIEEAISFFILMSIKDRASV